MPAGEPTTARVTPTTFELHDIVITYLHPEGGHPRESRRADRNGWMRRSLGSGLRRVVDVAGAAAALVVLSPVVVAVAIAVRLRMGRPILYRQPRVGLHGRTFEILKFRTMSDRRGPDGTLLPDAERLTDVGRFLRSTSLDELPELVNVLRGDMSLVGPRPLLVQYLTRYTPEQARRHDVRPGLTGWAQVNGRNATTWEERLAMDVWYVDNRNARLDLRILWRTVAMVVRRQDVSAPGHATMPEFMGSAND
jgi:sugar transferase EpsL